MGCSRVATPGLLMGAPKAPNDTRIVQGVTEKRETIRHTHPFVRYLEHLPTEYMGTACRWRVSKKESNSVTVTVAEAKKATLLQLRALITNLLQLQQKVTP